MTVALCVDDSLGRLFGGRRQSRDRVVTEDLLKEGGGRLWILPFSQRLFEGREGVAVASSPSEEGVWFLEDQPLKPLADRIDRMILYRWNRAYPADVFLDLTPEAAGLHLVKREELRGFSHERITKEVYEK